MADTFHENRHISLPDIHAVHRENDCRRQQHRRESEPTCTQKMEYRVPDRLPVDDKDDDENVSSDEEGPSEQRKCREPKIVGCYEIFHKIGEGAYATVRKAKHRYIKNEVAVKIIDKRRLNREAYDRLQKEIFILKSVDHPNIIKIHQIIDEKDKLYIFTELAERGELHDDIVKHHYSERKAKRKFWQLISAVEYLHNKGIVHRDLKAENILLDADKNIKIVDFGFGSLLQNRTHINTCCGSPPYAAPEMFIGKPYVGAPVDVWSLGVCLYAMTTGTMPFEGDSPLELRQSVMNAKFRVPYFLSTACEELLRMMIVRDPARRATVAQIKSHPWMERNIYEDQIFNELRAHYCVSRGASEFSAVQFLSQSGIKREAVQAAVTEKLYDHTHGMYNLLMEKYHRKHYKNTLVEIKRIHSEQGKREEEERKVLAKHPRPNLNEIREASHFKTMDSGVGSLTSDISRQSTYSEDVFVDESSHTEPSTSASSNTPTPGAAPIENDRRTEIHQNFLRCLHSSTGFFSPIRNMLFRTAVEAPTRQIMGKRSSTESVNNEIAVLNIDGQIPEKRSCPTPPYKRPDTPATNHRKLFSSFQRLDSDDLETNLDPAELRTRILHQQERQENMKRIISLNKKKMTISSHASNKQ